MKKKRRLKRFLFLGLAVVLLLPVWAVLFTQVDSDPVDYSAVIELDDGVRVPLGALLAVLDPDSEAARAAAEADPDWTEQQQAELEAWVEESEEDAFFDRTSLYDLGLQALSEGRTEQAIALLRSVPKDDRQYSRAQRFLGWDVYTRQQGNPEQGIPYALSSLRASPFEGNVWQDLYRVSFRALTPEFLR